MSVLDDVYAFLLDNGIGVTNGGPGDWTLVRRRFLDTPDQLVVLSEDGGNPPEVAAQRGIGDAALTEPGVLVSVRAQAWDGDASSAKAQAVFDVLHGLLSTTLVSGGQEYLEIRAMTPEPIFAGFDGNGRPLHTIAFRLLRSAL